MSRQNKQQIAISGIGGQGVLFITKLLAETAVSAGWSVLISETHGMAQRGGNVISHLKVSRPAFQDTRTPTDAEETGFSSPLIRAGRADVLLALHSDAVAAHGYFLKTEGSVIVNGPGLPSGSTVDADQIAAELDSPISANLVLTGFAAGCGCLFCDPESIRKTLTEFGGSRREINLKAFDAGLKRAVEHSRR